MFDDIRDPAERVRALCLYASNIVDMDTKIPVSRYFRSGKEMIRMAEVYIEEGNFEGAFILYSKYVTLFVEKVPKHPDYKNYSIDEKHKNKEMLKNIFPVAESIKTKLKLKYCEIEEKRREQEKKLAEEIKTANAYELMQKQKLLREEEEQRIRLKEFEQQHLERHLDDLKRQKEEELQRLEKIKIEEKLRLQKNQKDFDLKSKDKVSDIKDSSLPINNYAHMENSTISNFEPVVPDRNLKPVAPLVDFKPIIDRTLKPFSNLTDVGDNAGLKTIYVPLDLTTKFLKLAEINTMNAIESCGILCGHLARGTWRMTHLIIPKQHGKCDSCDVDNEEDLVEVQDRNNLITLGWIHTHPTQTAFLSSVDQHTQWPYQKLLPEAIAIVCAPKCNEIGYFNLTIPEGMDLIQNCRGVGFHEHPSTNSIYENCNHVKLDSSVNVTVIDLR